MIEASSTAALPTSSRIEERSILDRLVSIDKGENWLLSLNMGTVRADMIAGGESSQFGSGSGGSCCMAIWTRCKVQNGLENTRILGEKLLLDVDFGWHQIKGEASRTEGSSGWREFASRPLCLMGPGRQEASAVCCMCVGRQNAI